MLRHPPLARAIFNDDAVRGFLDAASFQLYDFSRLPFLDQARLFAEAETVVGSLGSDFWASRFSPADAQLVSLAPAAWEDGYFIRLFQRAGARHADVRGPSTGLGADDPMRSSHLADPDDIGAALQAVARLVGDAVTVDGEAMPRRLGREVCTYDSAAAATRRHTSEASGRSRSRRTGGRSDPRASLRFPARPVRAGLRSKARVMCIPRICRRVR